MGMPSEQRSTYPLCDAKKKNGDRCRAFAGQGTEHLGQGRCKNHGGSTRSHRAAAVRVEAARRLPQFGQRIEVEPTEALLTVLHLSAGHLAWIREELASREDKTTFEASVLVRQWERERDRVARIAKAALDAGVAERGRPTGRNLWGAARDSAPEVFADPELGTEHHVSGTSFPRCSGATCRWSKRVPAR
jgi:hypothetical protein